MRVLGTDDSGKLKHHTKHSEPENVQEINIFGKVLDIENLRKKLSFRAMLKFANILCLDFGLLSLLNKPFSYTAMGSRRST